MEVFSEMYLTENMLNLAFAYTQMRNLLSEKLSIFFYFGLIEGFEPKTCNVKVKKERKERKL